MAPPSSAISAEAVPVILAAVIVTPVASILMLLAPTTSSIEVEAVSLTEVPAVIFDIQRVGPSTGMPTRTQQCDIMAAAYASHGDTRHICLYPSNPEECFYMAAQAFDLAERLQTPVFVMSDLDIGMNDWMCRDLKWDDSYRPDRGKVLSLAEIEKLEKFGSLKVREFKTSWSMRVEKFIPSREQH